MNSDSWSLALANEVPVTNFSMPVFYWIGEVERVSETWLPAKSAQPWCRIISFMFLGSRKE